MRVVVGRVGKAHGVRGEVAVALLTDDPEVRFASGSSLYTGETGQQQLTVARSHWHAGRLLVSFEGAADRTAAEALTGTLLYRDDSDRVEEDGAWYDHDLIGCQVLCAGTVVGSVVDVLHLPAQDTLEVEVDGVGTRLVPLVEALVPVIDVGARRIEVADIPGLLFETAEQE